MCWLQLWDVNDWFNTLNIRKSPTLRFSHQQLKSICLFRSEIQNSYLIWLIWYEEKVSRSWNSAGLCDHNTLLWPSFQMNLILPRLDFDKIFEFQIFYKNTALKSMYLFKSTPAQVLIKCKITFCKNLFRQHIARYQKHDHQELAGWFFCCRFQTPILLWRVGWIKILWKVIWNGPKKMWKMI